MPDTYTARVAAEVRAAMARHGRTSRDLATILNVSAPTARARWGGSRPYTVEEVDRIAEALGVPVLDLLMSPHQPAA